MTVLNLQVGASGDDVYATDGGYWGTTDTSVYVGKSTTTPSGSVNRFTGVSGLSGATINSAQPQFYTFTGSGTPLMKMRAIYAASPAMPADFGAWNGATKTSAGVDWDGPSFSGGFVNAADITTVIQELADNFDPSTIVLSLYDDGSPNFEFYRHRFYDGSATYATKLDIDYTEGGGSANPWYYYAQAG